MLQNIINFAIAGLFLAFICLAVRELMQSQKQKEAYPPVPSLLRLVIDLKHPEGLAPRRINYHAKTVGELQEILNAVALFRILRAGVWDGTKMTYVMGPTGILEVV